MATTPRHIALASLFALACLDAPAHEENDRGRRAEELVNGTPTGGLQAVGQMLLPHEAGARHQCTVTLIGSRTVLTATHCVCPTVEPGCATGPRQVFFPNAGLFEVAAIATDPDVTRRAEGGVGPLMTRDVAVMTLAEEVTGIAPVGVRVETAPLGQGWAVGFGRTSFTTNDYGIKRFGPVDVTPCAAPEQPGLHVCWTGSAMSCQGDSGGPVMSEGPGGLEVTGVSSYAYGACDTRSIYVDVAASREFIAAAAGSDLGVASDRLPLIGDPSIRILSAGGDIVSQESKTFDLEVTPGTAVVRLATNGLGPLTTGKPNLELRAGIAPVDTASAACASTSLGSNEFCELRDPEPGRYQVIVDNLGGDGEFQLNATVFPGRPLATAEQYPAAAGETTTVAAADGVLANDSVASGASLTAILLAAPSHGTFELDPDGGFRYTAAADHPGSDAFTYAAVAGDSASEPTVVTIDVAGVGAPRPDGEDEGDGDEGGPGGDVTAGCAAGGGEWSALALLVLIALPRRRRAP